MESQGPGGDEAAWEQIGVVGVDSGQVVILDPCYIESEWVRNGEGDDWAVAFWGRDEDAVEAEFGQSPLSVASAADATNLVARIEAFCSERELLVRTSRRSGSSYDLCGDATMSDTGAGQLNYRLGHPGLAVASGTLDGDGVYPVYARRRDGMIAELRIVFDEGYDDEDFEHDDDGLDDASEDSASED